MALDAYDANMAAQASDIALRDAGSADPQTPAALQLGLIGTGRALLALAIGVNRLADAAENFTGGPGPRPGLDEVTGAIDRLAEQIGNLAG